MPYLIRAPEEILRATGQDIHFIRFRDGLAAHNEGREPSGKAELCAWLARHQPHVVLELIGPSEFSGWILGGIGGDWYVANWTTADITAFSVEWEDVGGKSCDERFQCYCYPYAEYQRRSAMAAGPLK